MRGKFDLILAMAQSYDMQEGLRQRVLFRDRLCVVARKDHPLSDVLSVTWPMLAEYPWVCPVTGQYHTVLENVMQASGTTLEGKITGCDSLTLLKGLVLGSDHLSLLPEHALEAELRTQRMVVLPIESANLNRGITLFFREGYDLAVPANALVDSVRAVGMSL